MMQGGRSAWPVRTLSRTRAWPRRRDKHSTKRSETGNRGRIGTPDLASTARARSVYAMYREGRPEGTLRDLAAEALELGRVLQKFGRFPANSSCGFVPRQRHRQRDATMLFRKAGGARDLLEAHRRRSPPPGIVAHPWKKDKATIRTIARIEKISEAKIVRPLSGIARERHALFDDGDCPGFPLIEARQFADKACGCRSLHDDLLWSPECSLDPLRRHRSALLGFQTALPCRTWSASEASRPCATAMPIDKAGRWPPRMQDCARSYSVSSIF